MKTETLPLRKLIPYAGNPRKNDHAVEQVAEAIKRFGFRVPILAKSDGTLIDGHLRIKALQHMGEAGRAGVVGLDGDKVPVILCDDLSDAEIKGLRISINRLATLAEWDSDLLAKELQTLAADGVGIESLGFDNNALDKLGINLNGGASAIGTVIEGDERRLTPEDKLVGYENTSVRQIVLIMDINEFSDTMSLLDSIKKDKGYDTNTEAALAAIRAYANHHN
jgi:ParB-like chromosome segregation protein Spo0J